MTEAKTKNLAYVSLIAAMVIWGGSFIAIKIAFQSYDPMVVMFGRMATASIIFIFFIKRLRQTPCCSGDITAFLLLGFFEPCLYYTLEANALVNTSASQAGVITAMLPVLVVVSAWIILQEKIRGRTVSGFLLAVAGACILSIGGEPTLHAPNPALGNFLEFLAMVSATGYALILKKLSNRYPALFLTAVQTLIGLLYFSITLFLPGTVLPRRFDPEASAAILFLGAVVTFGAYFLYNYGVKQMPVSRATAFVSLIPVFAILLGWLILNETLTPIQFASCGLILAGVFLSQA